MLWLIDGYNLMHAAGAAGGKEVSGEAFRRRRRRFLKMLADALGSERARETTIVFDASSPPGDFELESTYNSMRVIFALGDENADARIEQMIAQHSAPKSLTVVSTDHRIRRAATRRKAKAVTADKFLELLERLQNEKQREQTHQEPPGGRDSARELPLSSNEAAYWLGEFANLDDTPESKQALGQDSSLLTDDEIDRLQREIDSEP
jgi:predicted RNA-binding protein with PIN domain